MSTTFTSAVLPAADPISRAGNTQLILATLLGIATIVVLISWAKFHPFLALILGSAVLGLVAWIAPAAVILSFTNGFGSTTGSVGLLIALGSMVGKLLADSGGADRIVSTITGRLSGSKLPWGMALIAAIIGLPLFFEVGVVILVPVVLMVARKTNTSLMKVGIPALAGLSVLHGLVPPHPGPQTAIALLGANQSETLIFGLIVAVPTLIVAGPLLARVMDRWVPVMAPPLPVPALAGVGSSAGASSQGASGLSGGSGDAAAVHDDAPAVPLGAGVTHQPSFRAALFTIVLPVLLMLVKGISDLTTPAKSTARALFDFVGNPPVALLAATLVAYFLLGRASGMKKDQVSASLGSALPPIAGILLIVAAGGGFKQLLVDAGVGNVIKDWATGANISVLLLGWLVAVGIRLATGSATVATTTAAGIVGALAGTLTTTHLALLVLAIGCGSLFFSHVNDAGFWLVKEYFGLTVGQTIKSWSVMETVISVFGFALVMLLSLFV